MLEYKSDELIKFTHNLSKLHRSALPSAIRNTINEIAFSVKKTELQESVKEEFTIRNRNYFKAFSKVDKAEGFDISAMKSRAGMIKNKKAGTDRLIVQEKGGTLTNENIYLADARTSKSNLKKISGKFKGSARKGPKKSINKEKYVAAAHYALKNDRVIKYKNDEGTEHLIFVNKITYNRDKSIRKIDTNLIAVAKSNNKISVKQTKFLRKAAEHTVRTKSKKLFRNSAEYQIRKKMKK